MKLMNYMESSIQDGGRPDMSYGNNADLEEHLSPPADSLTMDDLPDTLLSMAMSFLTSPFDACSCRLVSKRWHACHNASLHSLCLSPKQRLPLKPFLSLLPSLPNLRVLSVPSHAMELNDEADPQSMTVPWFCQSKSDSVLRCIAASCPLLTHLSMDFVQRPDFSAKALDSLLQRCTALESLSLGNEELSAELRGCCSASLPHLTRLAHLSLRMPLLQWLPQPAPSSLTSLSLSQCRNMAALGPQLASMPALKSLELCHVRQRMDSSVWSLLTGLERLVLRDSPCLPATTHSSFLLSLPALTYLHVTLAAAHEDQSRASCLELPPGLKELHLHASDQMFSSVEDSLSCGSSHGLERVALSSCNSLTRIPPALAHLHSSTLQELRVTFTERSPEQHIVGLPDCFRLLSRLQALELSHFDLTAMDMSVWSSLGCLTELQLKSTTVGSSSRSLATALSGLRLQLLVLKLDVMEGIAEGVAAGSEESASHLEEICFTGSVEMGLSSAAFRYERLSRSLKALEITCGSFSHIPEGMGDLKVLKTMRLKGCSNLVSLPASIGRLTSLKLLSLENCPLLSQLPDSLGNLSRLISLTLVACGVKSLPRTMGDLTCLHDLSLLHCPLLEALPPSLGNMPSLRYVICFDLPSLSSVPESLVRLPSVREFVLENCGRRRKRRWPVLSKVKKALSQIVPVL